MGIDIEASRNFYLFPYFTELLKETHFDLDHDYRVIRARMENQQFSNTE